MKSDVDVPDGARPGAPDGADALPPLLEALRDPACYPHAVDRVELVETHISWVLLAGDRAYKIKKPVDLGFVDFGTLPRRRHYCEEEVRLNRRLAASLYQDVVPITGSEREPAVAGKGDAIEWAVEMARFDREQELDRVVERGALTAGLVERLADDVAGFHAAVPAAGADDDHGSVPAVRASVLDTLAGLEPCLAEGSHTARIGRIRAWAEERLEALAPALASRRREGFVRECHGDMHLANMVLVDGRIVPFDCIEFNEEFRWIDVMSEIAFLLMDLDHRGHSEHGRHFLDRYLERTGDCAGLAVLRLYLGYRALVRAKVACIRHEQAAEGEDHGAMEDLRAHLALAEAYASRPARGRIVLTHGLSASGKSWLAGRLVAHGDAVRIRSDVERKRLHGGRGVYTAEATERTYERLAGLACAVVRAGWSALVDATFLERARRERMRALAAALDVPIVILDVHADDAVLERRLIERARSRDRTSDADTAVLRMQRESAEPLSADERSVTVSVDTGEPVDVAALWTRLHA